MLNMTWRGAAAALCVVVGVAWTAGGHAADRPALKDAFAGDFRVGAAVGTQQMTDPDPAALALAARQFNSITTEEAFQWENVHPEPGKYNFGPTDRYVEFAKQNGLFLVGHALVWHEQTPAWVFEDEAGNPLDRDALLARMRDHIHAVVGRYKGRVDAWDVVNEALDDDGNRRETPWQKIIGDDYLEKAFQFAHEADPDAELYYNDFGAWTPGKQRGYRQIVGELKSKGRRLDGIGMQGHWNLNSPSVDEMDSMLEINGKLGVKLMITELDIDLLPEADLGKLVGEDSLAYDPTLDPYVDGLPPEVQQALADRYAQIFACFLRHRDQIDRVTFWGTHDGHTWLNNFPITGRTAYPLLFDRQLQPKPAFDAVLRTATRSQP
jgi:endo-1,4-beta-xylanase